MPKYDFTCGNCGKEKEYFCNFSEIVKCEECGEDMKRKPFWEYNQAPIAIFKGRGFTKRLKTKHK